MKIAIVGSGKFSRPNFVKEEVDKYFKTLRSTGTHSIITSDRYGGVGSLVDEVVKDWHGLNLTILRADKLRYGKYAGVIRDQKIVHEADVVIGFWDRKNKGVKIIIDMAIEAKSLKSLHVGD